jgi:hypothetical protein
MRLRGAVVILLLGAFAARGQVSTAIVPVVGNVVGVPGRWLTNVEIANSGAVDLDVALELPAVPSASPLFFTLSPGQVQRFPDIVGEAFGLPHAISPLRITTSSRRGVAVRAQAYPMNEPQAPLQPLDVYDADVWFPVRILDGLAFTDAYRTNIGLVNLGTAPAEFVLALQRIPGRTIAVAHLRVEPDSMRHDSIQALFPLITAGTGFSVVVESGARDTYVYASVIESASSSGKFITPRVGAR